MSNTKLITGILVGAGAAVVIGYLMTENGSEIRKKIKERGEGALDFLCDAFDKGKEIIKEYSEDTSQQANSAQEG